MAAEKILRVDPKDNVLVALIQLPAGEAIAFDGEQYVPPTEIPAKQKFAMRDFAVGDEVIMYGGVVGLVRQPIPRGGLLSTRNVQHDASGFGPKRGSYVWRHPTSRHGLRALSTDTTGRMARSARAITGW